MKSLCERKCEKEENGYMFEKEMENYGAGCSLAHSLIGFHSGFSHCLSKTCVEFSLTRKNIVICV